MSQQSQYYEKLVKFQRYLDSQDPSEQDLEALENFYLFGVRPEHSLQFE